MINTSSLKQRYRSDRRRHAKIAQKRALRGEYMGIDMTDIKAGRARKRAFNLEHGRYKIGRKAARTLREWNTWDAARKQAYT